MKKLNSDTHNWKVFFRMALIRMISSNIPTGEQLSPNLVLHFQVRIKIVKNGGRLSQFQGRVGEPRYNGVINVYVTGKYSNIPKSHNWNLLPQDTADVDLPVWWMVMLVTPILRFDSLVIYSAPEAQPQMLLQCKLHTDVEKQWGNCSRVKYAGN